MEKFFLSDLTVKNDRVLQRLYDYLDSCTKYNDFNKRQKVRIFYDKDNDFVSFEGVKYGLFFCSSNHKLKDDFSKERMAEVPFESLHAHIKSVKGKRYER